MNWINTIKGKDQLSSDFEYGAHLTEIMLLGIVSLRAKSQAALRRAEHAGHEQRGGESVPDSGVSEGVFAVIRRGSGLGARKAAGYSEATSRLDLPPLPLKTTGFPSPESRVPMRQPPRT